MSVACQGPFHHIALGQAMTNRSHSEKIATQGDDGLAKSPGLALGARDSPALDGGHCLGRWAMAAADIGYGRARLEFGLNSIQCWNPALDDILLNSRSKESPGAFEQSGIVLAPYYGGTPSLSTA
jgi:hypothetical protein